MQAVRLASTAAMPRAEWLELRRNGIGGSDMAAIAGLNPWKSPLAVYLEKTAELPESEDNERMLWGRILEDAVAQEFARRNDFPSAKVQHVRSVLQDRHRPYLLANVDRLVKDKSQGDAILEVKTTGAHNKEKWLEGVPDWVAIQVQHYLGVTGLHRGYVAVLIGGQEYMQFMIPRDDETIGYLRMFAAEFWDRVERRDPPPVAGWGDTATSNLLAQLHPASEPGSRVPLPLEAEMWLTQYREALAAEKEVDAKKAEAANHIKALMGDAEVGVLTGDPVVTWKTVMSRRLDANRLKAEQPDIYDRYLSASTARRFAVR